MSGVVVVLAVLGLLLAAGVFVLGFVAGMLTERMDSMLTYRKDSGDAGNP